MKTKHSKAVRLEAMKLNDAFNSAFGTYGLDGPPEPACRLIRLAREYTKLQEHACNGELTPRQAKREANIEREVRAICKEYYLVAQFDGDLRGYCIKLHNQDKTGPYNTWGGQETGYGIGEN